MSSLLPEGVRERPAREDDAEPISDLIAAADAAVQGWSDSTPEDVRAAWHGVDLTEDTRVVEDRGGLVAYAETVSEGRDLVGDGFVHPAARGRGLGSWILDRAEVHARTLGKERVLSWCLGPDDPARRLFDSKGYSEVRRYYRMTIDLDGAPAEPDWPDGIRVATLRDEDAAVFHETVNEAFVDEWNFVPTSFDDWRQERMEAPGFDPKLWFLAWDGDEVAGVARCDPRRFEGGWVGALGVRKPWRRRGIGIALLHHAFQEFGRRGETHVGLGVDTQNPTGATSLYERAGMRVAYEAIAFAKEVA
jgi:mycothiol synthase